jgi:hypothetical protein
VPGLPTVRSPLIRAGPARTHIKPGRARLRPDLNSELRAGLVGLVLIDHLYGDKTSREAEAQWIIVAYSHR